MELTINRQIDVVTDTATLALFDPVALKHRTGGAQDWFAYRSEARKEIAHGRMVLIPTPTDGEYRIRVTTDDPSEKEKQVMFARNESFWIAVTGSRLRIGAAENLPGASDARTNTSDQMIILPNGVYLLTLYGLDAPNSPPTGLPNVVIRLTPAPDTETATQPAKDPELWPKKPTRARRRSIHKTGANMKTEGVRPVRPGQPAEFEFQVNTGMLGLYDLAELKHTTEWPPEWTEDKTALLAQARAGKIAFAVSGALSFRTAVIRIQMDVLTIDQVGKVFAIAPECWFNVSSGEVVCAPSEDWPGGGDPAARTVGRVLSLDTGPYAATFYFLKPEKPFFPVIIEVHPLVQKEGRFPSDVVDALPLGFDRQK